MKKTARALLWWGPGSDSEARAWFPISWLSLQLLCCLLSNPPKLLIKRRDFWFCLCLPWCSVKGALWLRYIMWCLVVLQSGTAVCSALCVLYCGCQTVMKTQKNIFSHIFTTPKHLVATKCNYPTVKRHGITTRTPSPLGSLQRIWVYIVLRNTHTFWVWGLFFKNQLWGNSERIGFQY